MLAFLAAMTVALPCRADAQIETLLQRLAEEASAFEQMAPHLIAEETLRQRAQKIHRRRFRPRIPNETAAPAAVWQNREIRSEYAFTSVGDPPAIARFAK